MDIDKRYFEWLSSIVCTGQFATPISFEKLLRYLYETPFTYQLMMDGNRAADGVYLRYRYAKHDEDFFFTNNIKELPKNFLKKQCSVLEMMVALSLKIEETIMDNPKLGNRTAQWFWKMIGNMGLGHMYNSRYDETLVKEKVSVMLDRRYLANGSGGLFYVPKAPENLVNVEIWQQMMWAFNGRV